MTTRVCARWARTALGIVTILGAVGCGAAAEEEGTGSGAGPTGPTAPPGPVTPPPPLPITTWVDVENGSIPLVLIAPHGGDLAPADVPDRTCTGCVLGNDTNTRALALAIAAAFEVRVNRRPFLVVNRLTRRKFDGNRDLLEATGGHLPLEPFWNLYQERIDSAVAGARRVHPRALVIDLHGHGHAVPRLEIGYLTSATSLRLADSLLGPMVGQSSIAGLNRTAVSGDSGAVLLRGPRALGSRFRALGFPSVPSDFDPAPLVGQDYFNGGYNTVRRGSVTGGAVDAIQIETHYTGVRDTPESRFAFAEAFVTAVLAYLQDHYGWRPL